MNKQLNLFEQNNIDDIKSEMLRRRKQILVHSCLYYQFNTNLIEDWQYDKIARRLAELQIAHPEISNNLGTTIRNLRVLEKTIVTVVLTSQEVLQR